MPQVFDGISISRLDFTWGMPGSLATMVLADFGAEVIKVEPPGSHRVATPSATPQALFSGIVGRRVLPWT